MSSLFLYSCTLYTRRPRFSFSDLIRPLIERQPRETQLKRTRKVLDGEGRPGSNFFIVRWLNAASAWSLSTAQRPHVSPVWGISFRPWSRRICLHITPPHSTLLPLMLHKWQSKPWHPVTKRTRDYRSGRTRELTRSKFIGHERRKRNLKKKSNSKWINQFLWRYKIRFSVGESSDCCWRALRFSLAKVYGKRVYFPQIETDRQTGQDRKKSILRNRNRSMHLGIWGYTSAFFLF